MQTATSDPQTPPAAGTSSPTSESDSSQVKDASTAPPETSTASGGSPEAPPAHLDATDDAALVAQLAAHGVDAVDDLLPRERLTMRAKLRGLLGLGDQPAHPAPDVFAALGTDLHGLDPAQRLAKVEELAVAGDERVTGEVLARARADLEVAQLRARAAEREAAKGEAEKRRVRLVSALEAAADDVCIAVSDDDPDLRDAWTHYRAAVREARAALASAEAWSQRVRTPIRRLEGLRSHVTVDHILRGQPDTVTDRIDEAFAKATATRIVGAADPKSLTTALTAALTSSSHGGSSLWARIPLDDTTTP